MKRYPVLKHYVMQTYGGVEVKLYAFLTSALTEASGRLHNPGALSRGTHRMRDWVDPRVGLDTVAKRETPCPCRELNPGRSARSTVIILTELSRVYKL
jgi:hypothetical protein